MIKREYYELRLMKFTQNTVVNNTSQEPNGMQ